MKIRTGFVSNSSSSSFILAISLDELEACPHCGRKNVDLFEMLEDTPHGLHSKNDTIEELEEWIDDYAEDDEETDELKDLLHLTKNPPEGWQVRKLEIDYEEELIEHFIKNYNNIKILYEEGAINTENINFLKSLKSPPPSPLKGASENVVIGLCEDVSYKDNGTVGLNSEHIPTPIHDRILVKVNTEDDVSEGGIILPKMEEEDDVLRGEVLAVGEGCFTGSGFRIPLTVKVGQTVAFDEAHASSIKVSGVEYFVMDESSVLAIL